MKSIQKANIYNITEHKQTCVTGDKKYGTVSSSTTAVLIKDERDSKSSQCSDIDFLCKSSFGFSEGERGHEWSDTVGLTWQLILWIRRPEHHLGWHHVCAAVSGDHTQTQRQRVGEINGGKKGMEKLNGGDRQKERVSGKSWKKWLLSRLGFSSLWINNMIYLILFIILHSEYI